MPSQISLRTSPGNLQVGHIPQNSVGDGAVMKAAARTVGSVLVTHKAIRKPHNAVTGNLNGTCGRTDNSSKLFPKAYLNSSSELNGDIGPQQCHAPRTIAQHSSDQSSFTGVSNKGRLMCPNSALRCTGELIGKRAECLASKQRDLESRVATLQHRIRLRQLHVVHSHASRQLDFDASTNEQESLHTEEGSASSLMDSEFSVEVGLPETEESQMAVMDLPIQVDGASDDAFFPLAEVPLAEVSEKSGEAEEAAARCRHRNEDSFSSLDSYVSSVPSNESEGISDIRALTAQLASLERLLDTDLTEASSDEEGESSTDQFKHNLKGSWEHARSAVGCRWAWLQRRIAELNKQIYRLDHHVKGSCSQEKFTFSPAPSVSSAPGLASSTAVAAAAAAAAVLPQCMSLGNGSVLEHLKASHGGGLITMAGKPPLKHAGTNGFSHHHHATGHAQYIPHLLLPEGLLGTKLQVKDLLSPSTVDRNLLFVNEANCSAARTRPLVRKANRRIIRKRGVRGRTHCQRVDVAFHPHLSMAHELPSRIPLDSVMKKILSENSYAQLPPLSKRRKAASSLPHLSTPLSHGYDRDSASPSPVHTPLSLDSSRDGSARKKHAMPAILNYQNSVDSSGGSPWSPGISHPSTPNFTPLSNRRKRVTSSTPLFDIDNIVIPYSMASSTRLEKLEYKEILTPRWREVKEDSLPNGKSPQEKEEVEEKVKEKEEEDCSDQAYSTRHGRCEMLEKKRFLNFVSGNQRKRGRPQSMTLSDSPALTSPPPPLRRLTIASPSPTYAEPELAARVRTVVLPWQPRAFPLEEVDEKALVTPPPPPPVITQPTSPRQFCTSTPSKTPSCTSSGLATPIGSPHSVSYEESPAVSPVEWIVNSQLPAGAHGLSPLYNHRTNGTAAFEASPSPAPHNPIILKLTKKV